MKFIFKVLPVAWLISVLFLIGCCFLGRNILLHSDDYTNNILHKVQDQESAEKMIESKNKNAAFDDKDVKPISATEFAAARLQYKEIVNTSGVGAIYIPSSEIKTKIFAGMDNFNLAVGVGTYSAEQRLGEGNYIVMAHNIVEDGGVLNKLPNTKLGSVVYATDFSKIYEYITVFNSPVNQGRGEYLDSPKAGDPKLITLFRCEGAEGTAERYLLQGEFSKSYVVSEASDLLKEKLGLVEKQTVRESSDVPDSVRDKENTNNAWTAPNNSKREKIKSSFETFCMSVYRIFKSHLFIIYGVSIATTVVLFGLAAKY